jgi:putative Mg2+ transporter-C (MgtC) family protein
MQITDLELLGRLVAAAVLGAAIGLERESRDQPAGLRTHLLVSVGAALFTLVSAYAFSEFRRPAPGGGLQTAVDPTRIAAQIVTGIGFLGAGAIIRQGLSVRGLTTAAALWISAAIGMASGAGYYLGAVATTILVLGSLVGLRTVRERLVSRVRSDFVVLEFSTPNRERLADAMALVADQGLQLEGMGVQHEEGLHAYRLELRLPPTVALEPVIEALRELPEINDISAHGVRGSVDQSQAGRG